MSPTGAVLAVTIVYSRQSTLQMQSRRLERILLDGAKRHKVSAGVAGVVAGRLGRITLKHPEATRESHSGRAYDRFHQKQETQL